MQVRRERSATVLVYVLCSLCKTGGGRSKILFVCFNVFQEPLLGTQRGIADPNAYGLSCRQGPAWQRKFRDILLVFSVPRVPDHLGLQAGWLAKLAEMQLLCGLYD